MWDTCLKPNHVTSCKHYWFVPIFVGILTPAMTLWFLFSGWTWKVPLVPYWVRIVIDFPVLACVIYMCGCIAISNWIWKMVMNKIIALILVHLVWVIVAGAVSFPLFPFVLYGSSSMLVSVGIWKAFSNKVTAGVLICLAWVLIALGIVGATLWEIATNGFADGVF